MAVVETAPYQNGLAANGDLGGGADSNGGAAAARKSRESERRRRRRKQKKSSRAARGADASADTGGESDGAGDGGGKENADPQQVTRFYALVSAPRVASTVVCFWVAGAGGCCSILRNRF